jgi:sugar/nucleoside kinase (ribokinase family)
MLYVSTFPAADSKTRVTRHVRKYGGLTGMALVAAARLGARCAYAGNLGDDEASCHVEANFIREGVDVSHAPRSVEGRVVHAVIIVGQDTASRNIFSRSEGTIGAHPTLPDERIIRSSSVLFIDHFGMPGNLRAAKVARDAGAAVVADFEETTDPLFGEVLALVDHLILSEDAALRLTRQSDPGKAASALWRDDRAVVVVTCGARGSWSIAKHDAGLKPRHHPAFVVTACDTTGCGDVFHGAYAAALARGEPLDARIDFASAAAALKACEGEPPTLADVRHFLADPSRSRYAMEPSRP